MDNENITPGKKSNFYFELALFLILGFLLGVVIKTEAAKRVTIGFYDYKVSATGQSYDINEMQKNLLEEQEAQQNSDSAQPAQENGSCGG